MFVIVCRLRRQNGCFERSIENGPMVAKGVPFVDRNLDLLKKHCGKSGAEITPACESDFNDGSPPVSMEFHGENRLTHRRSVRFHRENRVTHGISAHFDGENGPVHRISADFYRENGVKHCISLHFNGEIGIKHRAPNDFHHENGLTHGISVDFYGENEVMHGVLTQFHGENRKKRADNILIFNNLPRFSVS
jgi:hypothetical protein